MSCARSLQTSRKNWRSEMAVMKLTNGKTALIDRRDKIKFSNVKWTASWSGTKWYVKSDRKYLHRLIVDAPAGLEVDHINGNSLDNRSENLRICTHQQNTFNSYSKKKGRKYKGIFKKRKKWTAQVRISGVKHSVGSFSTRLEAAKAYDRVARKYYGEFARTNF